MKNIQIISKKSKNLDIMRRWKGYIGKKVFSNSGVYIGKVNDIFSQNYEMEGFLVKRRGKLFIDKDYVSSDTGEAIMLAVEPVTMIVGKQVFDADGRSLGKVLALERKTNANAFNSIIVKRGLFRKNLVVPKEDIQVCSDNIILNKVFDKK
ncbi:PRC-barrel domain-containing protein [Candidatus Woesearchaeota archaeon]|nr:PRC-barrel domain-containing protein [Candidatus Woesearchaeota archaeon]